MTRRDCQECSEYEADAGDVLCYRCKTKPALLTTVIKPEVGLEGSEATVSLSPVVPRALAVILDDVERFVRRFVVFSSDAQSAAVALHVVHAYAIAAADTTGYLHIHSAEKRSGKTRLLEVLELLVPSPVRASTISPSALFRLLDAEPRTLLLDEVDAIFSPKSDREELRGLLNAGYRRGSSAWRVEVTGKSYTPTPYDAFGVKVLAGIGKVPDTIEDRCISLPLRRRRRDEVVEPFRYREARASATPLREELKAWCTDEVIKLLSAARPELPDLDDDRAAEAWEPLCAIADLAGGAWPTVARATATALHDDKTEDEAGSGALTLAAIRDLFADTDRLPTEEILRGLADRDDGPWPFWFVDDADRRDRDGSPSRRAARKLARVLEPYGIKPKGIRMPDGKTPRGYLREAFEDAWSRYLPGSDATTQHDATALASTVASVAPVASHADQTADPEPDYLRIQRELGETPPGDEEGFDNLIVAFPMATPTEAGEAG